ncbi:metallophosphoesterase [Methylobacterium persicinum]|uniref:metallophosphoesterase n=1 Tax=Methylobacterium persicinum TaxID=374426 RepID=UPI001EE3233C|nr:metallophosphoesterase [Methylobacterium persicinum]
MQGLRIWTFSDLHRRTYARPWTPAAIPDADVAVVAGDVGEGLADTVAWLAATIRPAMPVVLVPGNHEFYRGAIDAELAHGRRAAARQGIDLLENDTVALGGCTFSGCTLWTDYALNGVPGRAAAMDAARIGLTDHRLVARSYEPRFKPFRPEDALALHHASRRFLERALLERDPHPGRCRPHVVITHHAPSAGSVAPAYAGHPLNPAFASDLDALIRAGRPDLWVHGHVHTPFDYRLGATRVVCNPHGYPGENPGFDPGLVIEL